MPPGTTAKELLDRIMQAKGERLDDWLAEQRAAGLSYRAISLRLHDDWAFEASHETVSTWCAALNEVAS